ncbi:DUF2955 domain-containing protein [Shewanella aestuarii]|uniref:DUF2955 domain-containing protein n=1 Tax=Shewanella aestuarii TaxID=1028752 RepID=UPI001ABF8C4A|nr:DUF2955 domain-containing protein [Shewanella aestuarii]
MFRNAANPVIRLVFFPILLLFYLFYSGDPMASLAPIFVVLLLTIMPTVPPLNMLLKLLIVLLFICFVLAFLGNVLKDTPVGYSLFCWSLLFWSYYRSHRDPKDLISTLVLVVIIIITVMNFQMNAPMNILPWLIFKAFVIAIIVTYLSFLLFPGEEKDILPDEVGHSGAEDHIGLILFKATAMCIVLVVLMGIGGARQY